jgi:Ni,Fe-hydrogenase III component G
MWRLKNTGKPPSRRLEYPSDFHDDLWAVRELRGYSRLHVVDEERHACWVAGLL